MKRFRTLIFALVVLMLVGGLAVSAATTFAQGPGGNGNGGNGGNTAGNAGGNGNAGGAYANGGGEGYGYANGVGTGYVYGSNYSYAGTKGNGYGYLSGYAYNYGGTATLGVLDAEAIAALEAGLQDEYNAYNTYQAVIDQFGPVAPFVRIQQAEASHIAALEAAFARYGLAVPTPEPLAVTPVFASLADACTAGAAAEIANFALYDQWLASVQDYPDLVQVFTALRNASEFNHLPAFEACAG
ncbi:MAG: hypothetical protein JW910_03435 [Anaerolineae bacterium]|nr:hypothetical protein [Anaerolineae bacterium]